MYATVLQPLIAWWASIKGFPAPPSLNLDLLWVVITGMLGIGGLRTFEKSKGVSEVKRCVVRSGAIRCAHCVRSACVRANHPVRSASVRA